MAGETIITVVGNLTPRPELRYTQNGLAVANFTIASTPRTFDRREQRLEGRRSAVPPGVLLARVRRARRRVADEGQPGHRDRAPQAALVRRPRRATSAPRSSSRSTRSARALGTRRRKSRAHPVVVAAVAARQVSAADEPWPRRPGRGSRRRVEHAGLLQRRDPVLSPLRTRTTRVRNSNGWQEQQHERRRPVASAGPRVARTPLPRRASRWA